MRGDTLVDCNPKTEEMFDCSREDILKRKLYEFSPANQCDGRSSKEKAREKMQATLAGKPQFFEWKHKRLDGSLFDAEVNLNCLEINGERILRGIIRDVTDRKEAEEKLKKTYEELEQKIEQRTLELTKANKLLRQQIKQRASAQEALLRSEAKYRELVENAASIVLEMDASGNIVFFNKYAQEYFGFSEEEIIGRNVIGTIVSASDATGNDLDSMIRDIIANPNKYRSSENENIRKNGERVWVAWTNKVVSNPQTNERLVLCIGIDRTAQKEAQEELAKQLKKKAAAGERNRLARDLHDAVSQTLFSASLIAEVLPRLWEKDPEEGHKRLEEVRQLSRSALAEMRTLLFELRPSALAEAELSELLRQLADSVTGHSRLSINLHVEGGHKLPPKEKITFYRIAQEALNNVAKHANASKVDINLSCKLKRSVLEICDDGIGFDLSVLPMERMGIRIMKERAASIGASLSIDSKLGKTKVTAIWEKKALGGNNVTG